MKLMKSLFVAVLLLVANAAVAQMMPPLIPDKDVRVGKLDNGLTYYIRYNNWPENRAEFYIAQRVGSIQENDEQRGLAHFLEHMCFNGTDNFEGNEVIRWCESIGVQFGRDLNAYTSIDRTVYNISNVPTTRQSALDSCLLILHDWADGLVLDPAEIDKERGVIHEEWRMRSSAQQRMLERSLPKLYPGSKYGHRMPIGLMEIIDNFKPKALRDYYEKWYRPDNQAIIVVGDVNVDYIEQKIKQLFSGIKMPDNPAPVVAEPVPDNAEPIYVIEKDKEQQQNVVQLMFKHDVFPDSLKNNAVYLVANYMKNAALSMLNNRLAECAEQPDCPFVGAQAEDGSYIFAKTKDAFTLAAVPKEEGKLDQALTAVLREARRAAEFGFTPTEYERTKANILSALDKAYSNKDKRYSRQFVNEYVENYLAGEPFPSIDDEYPLLKQVIPMIPVEAVNQLMKEYVPATDSNMVVLVMLNEKEGNTYPTEAGLKKAIDNARAEQLTAYVDNVKDEPLLTVLPKKGSIKSEKKSDKFDYKELTLSNGVKVYLKHTDFKKDQVLLTAEGYGGSSLYGLNDYANLAVFNDVVEASGLGNFSNTELRKALAGKIAGATLNLSDTRQVVQGNSTPKDMETMFQLVYLYFTSINKDQQSFDNLMNSYELQLKNKALSPDQAFSDSLTVTLYEHNQREKPFVLDDLKGVNYDRILQIAKERTANAGAFTFSIIGNFDEAALRPLLEQYVASLPVQKKVVKGKRIPTTNQNVVNEFRRKMETPKATSMMVWKNEQLPFSLENSIKADIAGQVLSMVYLKKIREDASAAYSVGASGRLTKQDDYHVAMLQVQCPMKPEKSSEALAIMRAEVPALAKSCDADMLKKVKEYMLKSVDDAAKTNGYWSGVINAYRKYGLDLHTDYKRIVEAQTPESISAFATEFLKGANKIEVTMLPEE